jgi:hypothetical protein
MLTMTYGSGKVLHYTTTFSVTQQQLAQVFGSTTSKTQAPVGIGDTSGMPLWQILLVAGAALALLWVAGSALYKRVALPKTNAKQSTHTPSSQFKRPMFK